MSGTSFALSELEMRTPVRSSRFLALSLSLMAVFGVTSNADAEHLTINLSFDASFDASFGPNASQARTAATYAAQQLEALFSDPINVNVTLKGSAGTSIFGASNPVASGFYSYDLIRNSLIADAKGANDASAILSLPSKDPNGARLLSGYLTTSAEAKALGLLADNHSSDGSITLGAGYKYAFDPGNRAVAGEYDFIGLVQHELTEVMGRYSVTGGNLGDGGPDFTPPGVTAAGNNGAGVYFSINGGVTNLHTYNDQSKNGYDAADWADGQGADAFNQFAAIGVVNGLSAVDLQQMDVIGWNLASVPEPSTIQLLGFGAAGLVYVAVRRRSARRGQATV